MPSGQSSGLAEPFDLPPDPSSWAATLCTVIGRTLTSQELSVPGPGTPDNGC